MSSSHAVLADQKKHSHHNSHGGHNNNNTNKPTNDLAQIEKIKRIVQREILDRGRHLFPDGRWPSDGVADPLKHPEPYSAAMKFGGRDPSNKKRPGLTKRPPNMWMIFRMHAASVVMEDFPEVNQAALTSVLAPIWQSVITLEEKDLVREESERLKEFHKLQFPEWKYKPRQKKRAGQQPPSQPEKGACEPAPTKRECQHGAGAPKYARQQPQQQQQQHSLPHHQQHRHHLMQDAVSPYLSSGSPDIDHIDGLQLPLSVDTSPHASIAPTSSAGSATAGGSLPFAAWAAMSHAAIPVSLADYLPSVTSGFTNAAASASPMSPPASQQQQSSALKDPTLRSILAGSAPSSVLSSTSGEMSCLPDLGLPADYFNDFVLPDLEAYLSPEGCSGGQVSEPLPHHHQHHHQQQPQSHCDFADPSELRQLVKQEFSYAVI